MDKYIQLAAEIGKKATCERSQCGSVIVKDNQVIGEGFNSPPNNLESQRRCVNKKIDYDIKVTDKTCCMHAEQRAIMDALRKNPDKIKGSTLYFVRLKDGIIQVAGKPYCTICSKMALDVGIKYFVLLHETGLKFYDTEEYNNLSYQYH